ncbi:PBECR4 domain-containing protein, partial [Streptococcus sp. ST14]|uniref:PBECR4 domain-containing protein n=1 Tax=Streptococcus sp. ST14 TaxID=3378284 RepID=UPI0038D457A6
YLDRNQQLVGASLQGLVPDQERHPGKGYLKQIMYQSESISGLNVSIGSPKRLIVTEAPIDLMSYYELHKGELNDVRLVAMEGLKEGVLSHYVLEILQERGELTMDERDYTKSSELTRTSNFLSVAAETSTLFQDHKYDDLITLAVDRDKAGTDFITKLREKKIPVIDARPPQREGQEKTDWNEILKQEKQLEKDAPDNSRLAQARRKLERLRGEQDEAISRAYSHQALTNGQPMNDKRGSASFMRKQEQIEGQVFSKMDEIRQQEERVERLEHQQHLKEMGLNRQGSGLEMSVQNIPRIREELEKAKRGESFFTKATLKRYQEELTRLEAISEQMGKTSIQPATQALIDEGLVNQWQKQPNTYFVKGLRRVALELTEEGEFQLSSQIKYHPKTDEERLKVDELLAKQRQENVGLTPSNQEKSISPQPEPIEKNQGEAGWLEKNWDNLTFSIENKKTVVIDPTSIDKTVEEKQTPDNQESIELVWELHSKWEDELAEKIREDLGINYELQAWQFEKEMSRFITTDLDKLFAKRTRLERDAYFADSTTSIRKEIDRLDAQILKYIEKAPEQSQERLNDRASGGEGYSQHDAVGSAEPEAELSATFEQTVASHPTSPYRYLHFSTTFEEVQRRQSKYHPITSDDLKRMNQYAGSIQKSSQWYLEELANSKIYYFYSNNGEVSLLDVNFKRENFLHLTGIRPVVPGRNAGDFVVDFAEGRGDYNQILVSNSLKEKLQVIPMLEDILDPKSFVLDNLDEVRIAQRLNFSEAIKSKDEDFLLLFKDIGDERVPASLMKIKRDLRVDVEKTKEKVILGVFRERDGHIEQLSINENYIKDGGKELQSIMKNGLFEEIKPDTTKEIEQIAPKNTLNKTSLDSATFTQVLDTVYNLGVPGDISKTPEEFYQAWNQYLDYAKQHNDNFDQIVAAAGEDHLLDTNSDFYKEWKQDHIYKENYHVRLQWSEDRPSGPKLPFKETELISYQDFARELYKANQSFYSLHQKGLKQVTDGHPEGYLSPTKIQFSIYAPDGELIQDSIRYNIGEEINPIAHKERLGTREMREYPELMKIDGTIFTQYHLERLASELDISQFSYALEDTPYADQLLSQLPFGDLENSPIGFTDSSHDSRLGFISFDGMDSVEVESLSAWFEKLGVKDSPLEQVALVEKWQKEIKSLSEKVEQTIATVRDEFEKSQEEAIKLEEQGHNKQDLKRDADADGVSDEEELLQGTNPYDFRSKPGSKPEVEEGLQAEEVVLAAGSLAVADFIQNKDMAGLSRHLKEGIKEFLDSDKYRDYLTKMSQLNNYSNRNLRLILAQNPEARQVASFKQWKENFGRYVKKGEKALRIFKPMTKIKKDENNQPILDKNGKPETVTFFGLVPVFDVSQTEGKEMPKAAEVKEQLTDLDYANLYRSLMAIAKENDVSVRFEEMENNKHGYYSVPENQIVLRSNEMNKAQIIKTFLHEMAHAELHHADNPQKENLTRSTAELQAESVAYVVSSYYGIDTSEYSFNYLSGWSADKETLADLEAQLDIVQQEAKSLMVRMDQALEQLRLSQEKQTKRSFEQKLEKFKDQSKQAVEDHKQELKADAQSKKEKGFSK